MHDLDRAIQEFEAADTEFEGEYEFEEESESESDYEGEAEEESGYAAEYDMAQEAEGDYEAVFDELEEMEQAAALLEVQDEGELEQFLGGLIGKVTKKLRKFVPPQVQQALAGTLKKVAKSALPAAGAALGNLVAPGVGGVLGNRLASGATKMFGLELEGMSYEDQQFEVARRVVTLGAEATKAAAQGAQAGGAPPVQIAKDAVMQAAQTHAPGLAAAVSTNGHGRMGRASSGGGGRRTGRWYRRGTRIVIVGA